MNHCSLIWERRNVYMWGVPVEKEFFERINEVQAPRIDFRPYKDVLLGKDGVHYTREQQPRVAEIFVEQLKKLLQE